MWTAPLDQWLRGVDAAPVDLIKLDTDGFDFEILKGAEGTLRRDQPLVFAELEKTCLGWYGQTASDVAAFVAACGYDTWVLQPGYPPRFRSLAAAGPAQRDYLLVPRRRVPGLSWLLA